MSRMTAAFCGSSGTPPPRSHAANYRPAHRPAGAIARRRCPRSKGGPCEHLMGCTFRAIPRAEPSGASPHAGSERSPPPGFCGPAGAARGARTDNEPAAAAQGESFPPCPEKQKSRELFSLPSSLSLARPLSLAHSLSRSQRRRHVTDKLENKALPATVIRDKDPTSLVGADWSVE